MPNGPQNFHIGGGAVALDGDDVGLLAEDGAVVHYEPSVHLHKSAKYGDTPVKATLIGQMLSVEMSMGEYTWENMQRAYAGVTAEDGRVQFGGLAGQEVVGKSLVLSPFDGTEKWYFRNAVPTSAVETPYNVKNERVMKVTFTALIDIEAEEAESLGYFTS